MSRAGTTEPRGLGRIAAAGHPGWLVPPLVLGAIGIFVFVRLRPGPQEDQQVPQPRVLRVIELPRGLLLPRVTAYGTARPEKVWTAVAEVVGRVVELHPQLRSGAIIRQGTTLLRIDPTEYELVANRHRADLQQIEARLQELEKSEQNHQRLLEIEQAALELAEQRVERTRQLLEGQAGSAEELETRMQLALTQRAQLQSLENTLRLIPSQRQTLQASLEAQRKRLEQAEFDLARTEIRAPMDCRLANLRIERGQFLAAGQTLFDVHGIDATEVEAHLAIDQFLALIRASGVTEPVDPFDIEAVRRLLDLEVIVRVRGGTSMLQWQGRFVRVREQVDPRTRTVMVVVAVDRPYEDLVPGERPPLVKGAYCEVELRGTPQAEQLIIPRQAIDQDAVYVLDDDDRLRRQSVELGRIQDDFAIVTAGLEQGQRIVVSDPTPAIQGMLVRPQHDDRWRARLLRQAAGEEPPP